MRNIETSIDGMILTIKCDLGADTKISASGKSRIVATSEGNQEVENDILPGLKLGLNLYFPAK